MLPSQAWDLTFGELMAMFNQWQFANYDIQSFVKHSIEKIICGLANEPLFADHLALNPLRADEVKQQTKPKKFVEDNDEFSKPVVWRPV